MIFRENKRIRIIVLGALYFAIGYGSTFLDQSFSGQVHFWRLAAWVASAAVYFAATTHAVIVSEHAPFARFLGALVAWPLITGVPAFLVTSS
jgi:hypothetical protein